MRFVNRYGLFILSYLAAFSSHAQTLQDSATITLPASLNYIKPKSYTRKWGEHYRKEWKTPVKFKLVQLDTLEGGLIPYQVGGGRQSKSLRLHDKNNREWVLRSIDKSFGKALPQIAQNTFIESLVNDQVTIGHPYAALVVSPLAEAAGIFHTNPAIVYVPRQPSLGKFSDSMGNILYLLEQRPDENWETADNFGNATNIVGTDKMLEKTLKDNDNRIDQKLYLRSRLFDMFIGDWGRHDDQWRWAEQKDGKKTIYQAIPRDRDQAFTQFDGRWLKFLIGRAHLHHLQSFAPQLKDVNNFNFTARHLDRRILTELTKSDWLAIADDLKARLTNASISAAVQHLPREVYPISGPALEANLQTRRDQLSAIALTYFNFLNATVELTGSADDEFFDITRVNDEQTEVKIFKITNDGTIKDKPYYQRVFENNETSELRIFGIDGHDKFRVSGNVKKGMAIRLIGGPSKDEFTNESQVSNRGKKLTIYDNPGNEIKTGTNARVNISKDTAINEYTYEWYKKNKSGISPRIFYSNADRVYVGAKYTTTKYGWRKQPYDHFHEIDVRYSIAQKKPAVYYDGIFAQRVGKLDLAISGFYDWERWTNFFGMGNNSILIPDSSRNFNRFRSSQGLISVGLQRNINNRQRFGVYPFFQNIELRQDTARYLSKQNQVKPARAYQNENFGGIMAEYVFQNLNDSALPTKGFALMSLASFTQNLKDKQNNFAKFSAEANVYLPLTKKLGIFTRAGGSTLTGSPQFFQYNITGGTLTIRGHQRERFFGNQTFFNQNELRWISNVRSYIFNGKFGVFALYDIGRVWLKGENSNTWHAGYGGGIIISPFNRFSASAAYAVSNGNDKDLHLRLIKVF